jgi:hypothetical protein
MHGSDQQKKGWNLYDHSCLHNEITLKLHPYKSNDGIMTLDKRDIVVASSITLMGLLLRIVFVYFMQSDPLVYDSKMYLMVADGIVNEAPISSFPNGYPLVIALFRSFLPTAQTVQALLGLNVLLSTACIPLTYIVCRMCRPERWLTIAASTLMAIYPHQLRYAQLVMTETIATFVLLAAMVGAIWVWTNRTKASSVVIPICLATGLLFHMTGAIRPSLMLIGILVPVAIAWFSKSLKLPILMVGGFLVGAGLLFVVEKSPLARPPHAFGNNLLISINSDSNGTEFVAYPEEQQKKAVKTYIEFSLKNPSRFLKQRAISLWELWGPKSLAGYRQEQESAAVKGVVFARTLLLLLFIGAIIRFRRHAEVHLLGVPLFVITVVHTMTFSNHRFLVPIEPYLFIGSSLAVGSLIGLAMQQLKANRRSVAI